MGILDQYKKAIEEEQEANMDFPTYEALTAEENEELKKSHGVEYREEYEKALKKFRNAEFSKEEIEEAIRNSKKNMEELGETHTGGQNENVMRVQFKRIHDEELRENGLLKEYGIGKVEVLRAYCPKCGKEMVSKAPPMYNPFTLEKVCMHECCGEKYNLDNTYPHIVFYDTDGNIINSFF